MEDTTTSHLIKLIQRSETGRSKGKNIEQVQYICSPFIEKPQCILLLISICKNKILKTIFIPLWASIRSALGSQPDAVPQAEGGIGQVHFGRKGLEDSGWRCFSMSQQCVQVAKKPYGILASMTKWSSPCGDGHTLNPDLFWTSHFKRAFEMP